MYFNPSRLTTARLLRGLTQTEIARKLNIIPRTIRGYENGEYEPENIKELASVLELPVSFFMQEEPLTLPSQDAISFRAASRLTVRTKNQARSLQVIAHRINKWFERKYNLPSVNLPNLLNEDPVTAAMSLRKYWGLADKPISNMISLLEKNGIRVFSLAIDNLVDANCVWFGEQPYVFMNTTKSTERDRFNLAHELGHLVLHSESMRGYEERKESKVEEKEANEFAAAFLMPESSVSYNVPSFITVDMLIEMKKRWGVSLAALAYRLFGLGKITEWVYTRVLSPEMARKGYRTKEPSPMPTETSSLLTQVFNLLKEDGLYIDDLANDLNMPIKDIQDLVFNLGIENKRELTIIKGQGLLSEDKKISPTLKLIK
ncbi:hypothetical protein B9T19_03725 [Ignatzschineria sp. F8392]|uniref:XRE family transcriptional regulator n=1 Tax=Ignatzschineria sp. F8392 TaxID=1980117 RepID=UPI000B98B518|nr:ImmA/IrrE family metallo-endopeptidase [Ignatzschineria sp. F8392]OYQ81781.1 hypothetical protein B9T19_03725 [Ignatzschineria sp. F8392]